MKKEPKNKTPEAEPKNPMTYSISEKYPDMAKALQAMTSSRERRKRKAPAAS